MRGPQRENEFGQAVIAMRGPHRENGFGKVVIDNVYTLPRFVRTSERQLITPQTLKETVDYATNVKIN